MGGAYRREVKTSRGSPQNQTVSLLPVHYPSPSDSFFHGGVEYRELWG